MNNCECQKLKSLSENCFFLSTRYTFKKYVCINWLEKLTFWYLGVTVAWFCCRQFKNIDTHHGNFADFTWKLPMSNVITTGGNKH